MTPKITIVGGGSTHWAPRLLADFANTASLHDCTVALTDIDESSLPPMLTIAKHIVTTRGIGMEVSATTDLGAALEGADFVIIALSVGGFASMAHDLEIPARYGLWQPVGDSVGPGGISRSLRSIPVVMRIAAEVERHAPGATVLNVSNPLTALCRAVSSPDIGHAPSGSATNWSASSSGSASSSTSTCGPSIRWWPGSTTCLW